MPKACFISVVPDNYLGLTPDKYNELTHQDVTHVEHYRCFPSKLQTAVDERTARLACRDDRANHSGHPEKAAEFRKERHGLEAIYRFHDGKMYSIRHIDPTTLSPTGTARPFDPRSR